MVLLCHVPKDFGQRRREQKLRNILCRWAVRKNRHLSKMAEADRRNDVGAVSVPLGLAVVNDAEDLHAVALFRERFPLGLLVTVVFNPDHDLLVSLQRYSPSFLALSEMDDAALPQVLDQLCRRIKRKEAKALLEA